MLKKDNIVIFTTLKTSDVTNVYCDLMFSVGVCLDCDLVVVCRNFGGALTVFLESIGMKPQDHMA
jgi:hypothetical protein